MKLSPPAPCPQVLLSVTLVLFFGEIIPSAVFTGPSKLRIAAAFKPFVDVLLLLLSPVSQGRARRSVGDEAQPPPLSSPLSSRTRSRSRSTTAFPRRPR